MAGIYLSTALVCILACTSLTTSSPLSSRGLCLGKIIVRIEDSDQYHRVNLTESGDYLQFMLHRDRPIDEEAYKSSIPGLVAEANDEINHQGDHPLPANFGLGDINIRALASPVPGAPRPFMWSDLLETYQVFYCNMQRTQMYFETVWRYNNVDNAGVGHGIITPYLQSSILRSGEQLRNVSATV